VSPRAFSYDLDEAGALLVLHGELDESASVELRDTIAKATDELRSGLAVDLTDVSFLPSPAIGVLASSQSKARRNGADIVLVAPPETVAARLLTICALDHVASLDG